MYKCLGDHIREVDVRNRDLSVTTLLGVSISKEFIPSIANTIGTDMSTYKIVRKGQFAYGPVISRNGDKVSIALLANEDTAIISQAYTVFEVKDTNELLSKYLMMWFRRLEFDRYARFYSHGSASKADLFIEPIDFSAEANNIIRIVNQLEVKGLEKRISDLKGNYCSELSEMFYLSKPTYYEIEELLESCTPCTFVYDENIQPMYEFSIFGKMEDFLRKKDVYKVKNKE